MTREVILINTVDDDGKIKITEIKMGQKIQIEATIIGFNSSGRSDSAFYAVVTIPGIIVDQKSNANFKIALSGFPEEELVLKQKE